MMEAKIQFIVIQFLWAMDICQLTSDYFSKFAA